MVPVFSASFAVLLPCRLTAAVSEPDLARRTELFTNIDSAPNVKRAHPRTEHLIPLLVVAGAAVTPDGAPSVGHKTHDAWVLDSMSLASYRFD